MSTTNAFDLNTFKRAIEERDASTQLEMYAEDAEVTLADRITQPRSPRVLHGRDEIRDLDQRRLRTRHDPPRPADRPRRRAAPPSPKPAATPTAPTSSAPPSWRPRAG